MDTTKRAPALLVDLVKKYPGNHSRFKDCNIHLLNIYTVLKKYLIYFISDEITIVVLGPLTNIAKAIMLDPNFLSNVKELVIMGSNTASTEVEFNFKQDPESNWITFNNTKKPHTVFPINTVLNHPISKVIIINTCELLIINVIS